MALNSIRKHLVADCAFDHRMQKDPVVISDAKRYASLVHRWNKMIGFSIKSVMRADFKARDYFVTRANRLEAELNKIFHKYSFGR